LQVAFMKLTELRNNESKFYRILKNKVKTPMFLVCKSDECTDLLKI